MKAEASSQSTQSTQSAVSSGVGRQQRPLLERTRPFVVTDRRRRSLVEALQVSQVISEVLISEDRRW